jgi:hypothetical protein
MLDHPARAIFWVRVATTLILPEDNDAPVCSWLPRGRLLESNKKCHIYGTSNTISVGDLLVAKRDSF